MRYPKQVGPTTLRMSEGMSNYKRVNHLVGRGFRRKFGTIPGKESCAKTISLLTSKEGIRRHGELQVVLGRMTY